MKNNKNIWLILSMRCLLFIAMFSFLSVMTHRNLTELTHWWSAIASVINIVTICILWILCRRNNTTYREMLRYEKGRKSVLRGFVFIISCSCWVWAECIWPDGFAMVCFLILRR